MAQSKANDDRPERRLKAPGLAPWRRHALGLGVSLLALQGCGAGTPPAEPRGNAYEATEPAAATATPEVAEPAADPRVINAAGDGRQPQQPETQIAAPGRSYGQLSESYVGEKRLWDVVKPTAHLAVPQDYKRWTVRRQIQVGQSHLSSAGMFPDEQHAFVVGSGEGLIRIYDLRSGRLVSKAPAPGFEPWGRDTFGLWPSDESPLGAWVIYAGDHALRLLEPSSGEVKREIAQSFAWDLRWTRNHDVLGAIYSRIPAQTSALNFFDAQGDLLLSLESKERIEDWALSGDGKLLAINYYPSNSVELIDLEAGEVRFTAGTPEYANSLDFSPDDQLLAVAGEHTVVMKTSDGGDRKYFRGQKNNAHQVRFSPSGDALVVSSYDGRARVLKPGDGDQLTLIKELRHGGTANVYVVEFSQDGTRLLTSSGDRTLKLWGAAPKRIPQ
ncbi:MAG: WD40 repeat domain-containing protein [Myxococcales bacterium]|nr:WD40 repeat domain-containing protein [Myxococcales bacterium]